MTDTSQDTETGPEPIDAEFEPARGPEPGKVGRHGPGWGGALILALFAAAAGGAIGYGGSELAPGMLTRIVTFDGPGTPRAAIEDARNANETARADLRAELGGQIDALSRRVQDLEARLDDMPSVPSRAELEDTFASREAIAALRRRLSALESVGATGDDDAPAPAALSRSVAALAARMDELETASGRAATREDFAALREELDRLGTRLAEAEANFGARQEAASSRQAARTEAALALSTIEAAARRGQGFAAALTNLQAVRPDAPSLGVLEPIALDGAPTLSALKGRFGQMAEAVRQAARPVGEGNGALSVAERLFGDAIEVRREGEPAVVATLEAARAALDEDDLGGAISALETLEEPALAAAQPWLEDARARRTLERALDGLRLALMREDE